MQSLLAAVFCVIAFTKRKSGPEVDSV